MFVACHASTKLKNVIHCTAVDMLNKSKVLGKQKKTSILLRLLSAVALELITTTTTTTTYPTTLTTPTATTHLPYRRQPIE